MEQIDKMVKIIIVDDDKFFRTSVRNYFSNINSNFTITGEADCGESLFKLPELKKADIILLDIILPDIKGNEIAHRLRKEYPELKILVTSTENSEETVRAMFDAGINGFICKKNGTTEEIETAINSIMENGEYFGQDIASILYKLYVCKKNSAIVTEEFSESEREIIQLCKKGLKAKEIASQLDISVRKVVAYKEQIFKKLGINNTMEMVQYAMDNGIIRVI